MTKLHTWNFYDDPSMMHMFNSFSFYWQLRGTNHVLDCFLSISISSVAQSCLTLCNPMDCSTPGFPVLGAYSNSCPSSQWCHPTNWSSAVPFSSCLQSFPASGSFPMSQFFASDGQKYRSFSFSISPSNEYSGLISFRIDWLDLLEVQGTLKSLLQHHSSKALILQFSTFFIIQLSHPYMTTAKPQLWLDGPLSAK